jgi:benzoyl-CoA reductase/2-hydroxyglutaryl-CoA dehydratase subunit BcrC/BadD/HgdB
MTALGALISACESAQAPDAGVVGCVGADVPRELVRAAGLHPVTLRGSGASSQRADEILGPRVGLPERAVLAALLEGRPRLDFALLAHDSDSTVRLFTALRVLASKEPLPTLWFVDLLHLPTETTAQYNRARLEELLRVLERWSGGRVFDERLGAAIRDANETRRLLCLVAELRRASPPLLRGSDALAAISAASVLPPAEANRLLGALIGESTTSLPPPPRRVFVTGSVQVDPGLYRTLEAAGFHVAGDDHDPDGRLVAEEIEPLEAIAAYYPLHRHGASDRAARTARAARDADADVVLAWIRKGDDSFAWGLPTLRRVLDVPLVVLEQRRDDGLDADDLAQLA